jgi:hypothetical protein
MSLTKAKELEKGVMEIYEIPKHIRLDGDYIVIDYGGYDYDIHKDRVNSQAKLLDWVLHLSEKRWMNCSRLHYFAELAAETNGFKLARGS